MILNVVGWDSYTTGTDYRRVMTGSSPDDIQRGRAYWIMYGPRYLPWRVVASDVGCYVRGASALLAAPGYHRVTFKFV